jgi:2-keto-3-deoxy-6-phosphogluconate aldolase
MRADESDLERALDHAPAMVLPGAPSAEHALLVASASIAGGFRTFVIDLATEQASDLLATLVTRHDTVVGCLAREDSCDVEDALSSGASFLLDASGGGVFGELARDRGCVWIPRINTIERSARRVRDDERWGWYEPGGDQSFHDVRAASTERHWLAGPSIPGNRVAEWIDAGARAVVLSEAIYSDELLQRGDRRSIRDYAAAVHREATRASRVARRRG